MSTLTKLESDFKSFIENIDCMAAGHIEKIRADLNALKDQAAKFG